MAILEVTIDRDFTALGEFIGRVIPGANVKIDALNGYVVLTGTVQNPIDATRAGEIATAFVTQAQGPTISSNSSTTAASGGNSTSAGTSTISGRHGRRPGDQHDLGRGPRAGAAQGLRGGDGAQYPEAVRRRPRTR